MDVPTVSPGQHLSMLKITLKFTKAEMEKMKNQKIHFKDLVLLNFWYYTAFICEFFSSFRINHLLCAKIVNVLDLFRETDIGIC